MNRKLGIDNHCFCEVSPIDALDLIKDAGFDCFFDTMRPLDEMFAIKDRGEKLGLEFEFIHAPFKGINSLLAPGMGYLELYLKLKECIDYAAAIDVRTIILHVSSGWNPPELSDIGLSRFDSLVEYAYTKGVTIAFENLRMVGNLAYLADRYENTPNVKFCYDIGHEHCYTKYVCMMDIFRERMVATHIHDNYGRGHDRTGSPDIHLLPFDGNIDYTKVMRKLDEYNYTGSLMLEVFQGSTIEYRNMSPEDFIATAYDRIKRISLL